MYKLFILASFFAIAAAYPGYLASSPLAYSSSAYLHQPAYSRISYQSISQVQPPVHYEQSIVAPVLKTAYSAPLVKAVTAPVVHSSYAPVSLLNSVYAVGPIASASYAPVPVLKSYAAAAPVLKYAVAGPIYGSYSTGQILKP